MLDRGVTDSIVLQIIFGLLTAGFIIAIFGVMLVTLVLMVTRFYRNLLKDEGYLMFTLPTNSHALIWSKLIVSTVWFLATALLIGLLMMLTVANLGQMSAEDFNAAFYGIRDVLDMLYQLGVSKGSLALLLTELVVASVVTCLTTCLHFYAAMGLGQMSANHKGLMSVLAFIGISIAFQILASTVFSGLVKAGSVDLIVQSIEDMAQSAQGVVRVANSGVGSALLLEVLQGAVLYVITALSLNKKLNLA
jgi:hypothetical protein